MSSPADPPPALLPWVLTSVVAVVVALWAALRASISRELAFVKGELQAERKGREDDRKEARAALERLGDRLDREREGRRLDNERAATALYQARPGAKALAAHWEADAPTGVRNVLAVTSIRPHERLLRRADAEPVASWSDSTPPEPTQRSRG